MTSTANDTLAIDDGPKVRTAPWPPRRLFGPEEKQALLEAQDLKSRADVLIALAEMEMASGGGETGGTLQ